MSRAASMTSSQPRQTSSAAAGSGTNSIQAPTTRARVPSGPTMARSECRALHRRGAVADRELDCGVRQPPVACHLAGLSVRTMPSSTSTVSASSSMTRT
jgi:hypothetical protein